MKADQIQLASPPEMILLMRISSGAGNTQHLLAAYASWATARRGEQTVPGCLFVPLLILYGTCYERHLDCAMFHPAALWLAPWEIPWSTKASSRDTLIIDHPLTNLVIVMVFGFSFSFFFFSRGCIHAWRTDTETLFCIYLGMILSFVPLDSWHLHLELKNRLPWNFIQASWSPEDDSYCFLISLGFPPVPRFFYKFLNLYYT